MRSVILDEVGNLDAPPGSKEWAVAIRAEIALALGRIDSVEESLANYVRAMQTHHAWRELRDRWGNPFKSWEAFCRAPRPFGLGRRAESIEGEIKRRAALAHHGGDRKSEQAKNQVCDTNLISKSTNRAYILARLERDAETEPDKSELLGRVNAGELSANRAAVLAHYRKEKTALEQLRHWWKKATADERELFQQWIGGAA